MKYVKSDTELLYCGIDMEEVYQQGRADAINDMSGILKEWYEIKSKADADGCKDCAFEDTAEWEMPCAKCKRNCKDYWRAKNDK